MRRIGERTSRASTVNYLQGRKTILVSCYITHIFALLTGDTKCIDPYP